jgi:predicted DNA binding CopG/RHH family protein
MRALAASGPIEDFLPPPEKLVFKRPSIKVTLALSQESVEFFKQKAKDHRVSYQAMIREVVQRYAERYQKAS